MGKRSPAPETPPLIRQKYVPVGRQAAVWVRYYRTAWNLSQADLARLARVTQATVSAIESGRANPKLDTLQRIARVLKQDVFITFRRHVQ